MSSKRPPSAPSRHLYQSVTPACNMLLQKKWDQKMYDQHRDRVLNAKPIVDDRLSLHHMEFHLHLKSNKKFVEDQKRAQIKKDNEAMLVSIMNAKGMIGPYITPTSCPAQDKRPKSYSYDHGSPKHFREPLATSSTYHLQRPGSAHPPPPSPSRANTGPAVVRHSTPQLSYSSRRSTAHHHIQDGKERRPPWL